MEKQKGFTLIELLAVIIILAVILAITVPAIAGLIETGRRNAFDRNVGLIIKAIEINNSSNKDFNVNDLSVDNMEDVISVDNDNFESVSASIIDDEVNIDIVGKNKWDGLEAHGTRNNLSSTSSGSSSSLVYGSASLAYEYTSATTELTLDDKDEGCGIIPLNFNLKFGNKTYSTIYVGTNGVITFYEMLVNKWGYTDKNINKDLATGGVSYPIIAAYWSDLIVNKTLLPNSGIFYTLGVEEGQKYVLVEFRDVLNKKTIQDVDHTGNFEVKIYENGLIKMIYKDVSFGDATVANGLDATAGVYVNNTNYAQRTYKQSNLAGNQAASYNLKSGTIAASSPTPVIPADACFTFDSVTGTITAYDYTNPTCSLSIEIPSTINGVSVQNIGASAFEYIGLKHVTIPSSVITIGDSAFASNANNLASVDLSKATGLTTIGPYAFCYNQISDLVIPSSVTTIGNRAFLGAGIINVDFSNATSLTTMATYAFAYNPLDTVDFTGATNLTAIPDYSFCYGDASKLVVPSTVTSIGSHTFYNAKLASIDFSKASNVATIDDSAFHDNFLTSVDLTGLSSLSIIDSTVFAYNKLASATIPSNITSIGWGAFQHNNLKNIIIPTGTTTILDYAFQYNLLEDVTIPSTVTSIAKAAFNNNLLPDDKAFIYARNAGGSIDYTTIVSYGGTKTASIVIPEGVTTLGPWSFASSQITSITLPTTLTTIGDSTFYTNLLANIDFPSGLTSIGSTAFYLNQLASVVIPDSVTTIGSSAFIKNQLISVTLPANLTSIGFGVFQENLISSIIIPSSVVTIGSKAFYNNQLSSITIPNSTTTINTYAFQYNNILQGDAKIDNYATPGISVSSSAFYNNGADRLTAITPVYMRN
jgi:prepilin-type N-terminal cleavage/methylation domain-containing protein